MTVAAPRTQPLRVGLLSEFVYPFRKGGAERRFYEIATRLAGDGHEVHWFGMHEWDGPARIELEGVHVHGASAPIEVYAPSGQRAIAPTVRLGAALSTALWRSRLRFDVIDLSLYPFFHIFGARVVRPRTRLVVSWHEWWGDHWREYVRSRASVVGMQVERFASRTPQRIIASSELARDGLIGSGIDPDRVVTVHNGVDVAEVAAVPVGTEGADLVFFGRLKNHKNVDLLLRAVAIAREARPSLTCLIVGGGPEDERLRRLAAELELGDSVRFTGAVDTEEEMLGYVKASRVCVNPSTKEGGGSITLLESYASGVPVVAIRHPLGIDTSLIREGETGWWAPAAEPTALAATLLRALDDDDRLAEMSAACRRFVRSYDWNEVARQYERTYREVLAQ